MSDDIEMGFGKFFTSNGSDPTVFENVNNPAIENPFKVALDTSLVGDPSDVQVPASVLMEFKNLYTPTELTSILNSYETQTGDKEGAALLKNLFGTDTTLSDTAIKEANKMPVGEGDIASTTKSKNLLERLLSGDLKEGDLTNLLKGLGAAYMAKKAYDEGQEARNYRRGATMGINAPVTATRRAYEGSTYKPAAQGGIMSLAGGGTTKQPFYLGGSTDGMADEVPAHIDNKRPAALSDGEFVIPADVVSHLGNGNSNAGAQRLYKMMDDIRHARTGNVKQGRQINPNKFMPR